MATYYVSTQRGDDDLNDGLSAAAPWATINKAVGEVAAGDTVYIGPGTYREKISLATAGSEGNIISWIPDPQVEFVEEDTPGIVRITGCDVDEYPTSGIVWNYNGKNYNTLGSLSSKIYIDGSNDNYVVNADSGTQRVAIGAIVHGYNGFNQGINTGCIAICGAFGFYRGNNYNCLSIGGQYGFIDATNVMCIAFGGVSLFTGTLSNSINCLAIGGTYSFYQHPATNCIAMGSQYGYSGNSLNATFVNCRTMFCVFGVYGESSSYPLDTSTISALGCWRNQRTVDWPTPGTYYETDEVSLAKSVIYDLSKILEVFKPLLQFNTGDGDDSVSIGDYDILGQARRLLDGSIDIGPYEHSLVSLDFSNEKSVEPALKLERKSMQHFVFHGVKDQEFSYSIWTKWENVSVDKKPQLIARGSSISEQVETATGDGTSYEKLIVSATPSKDGEINLYLFARDESANAVVYFSDLGR